MGRVRVCGAGFRSPGEEAARRDAQTFLAFRISSPQFPKSLSTNSDEHHFGSPDSMYGAR